MISFLERLVGDRAPAMMPKSRMRVPVPAPVVECPPEPEVAPEPPDERAELRGLLEELIGEPLA
jgi:hypothetical protein